MSGGPVSDQRSAAATVGRGQRQQYASPDNLAKRQAIFAFRDQERSSGEPAIGRIRWETSERVLDAGCGNGTWLRSVAKDHGVRSVVGLDMSKGMLDAIRLNDPSQSVVVGDVGRLPFGDASFDTAMALWMLYHVPDHRAVLDELRRVLRPGGRLLAATNSTRPRALEAVLADALSEALGRVEERWFPQLNFTAENGAGILGEVFDDVATEHTVTVFSLPSPEPALGWMESLRGPIEIYLGEKVDWASVADLARQRIERIIAEEGVFRTEIASAWFVAHRN